MTALLSKWIIQSPPAEWAVSRVRELLLGALRQGPIPRHIAFVMDGNRRYARKNHIETVEGHNMGFEALARILEICYKAGVRVVTIYAFSIENFKRSKYEVDALMEMAKVKLVQLAQHGELFYRYGACVRILGQRELVRPDVHAAIDEAVNLTKHNKKAVLNICFPYTSRDEITTAIRSTVSSYLEPLPSSKPNRRRPIFSEERIAHNIRSRRLSTLREESASRSPVGARKLHPSSAATTASIPQAEDPDVEQPVHASLSSSSSTSSTSSSSATLTHEPDADTNNPSSRASSPSPCPPQTTHHAPRIPPSDTHPSNLPNPETITAQTLTDHMYTATSPPLDLLIRTSGVERLSDFMLWQCHENTSIVFLDCLWPEFDLWRFLPVLAEWQWWRRRGAREAEVEWDEDGDFDIDEVDEEEIDYPDGAVGRLGGVNKGAMGLVSGLAGWVRRRLAGGAEAIKAN